MRKIALLLSVLVLASGTFATVRELPPTYESIVGTYFSTYAGSTIQRLVLHSDKTGIFVDAGHEPQPPEVYRVEVTSFKRGSLKLRLTPSGGGTPVIATGDGSYFELRLKIRATPQLGSRRLFMHREQVVEKLVKIAREATPE